MVELFNLTQCFLKNLKYKLEKCDDFYLQQISKMPLYEDYIETFKEKLQRHIQIQANKFIKCRRETTGETANQ